MMTLLYTNSKPQIAIMYLTAFFSGASCIRILLVLGISLC